MPWMGQKIIFILCSKELPEINLPYCNEADEDPFNTEDGNNAQLSNDEDDNEKESDCEGNRVQLLIVKRMDWVKGKLIISYNLIIDCSKVKLEWCIYKN